MMFSTYHCWSRTQQKKRQVNILLKLESEQKLDARDEKKYKVKAIYDNKVYAKEATDQLSELYYLISWKGYIEKKST